MKAKDAAALLARHGLSGTVRLIRKAIANERAAPLRPPLSARPGLFLRGFKSQAYFIYDQGRLDEYVSDVGVIEAGAVNGPLKRMLEDKLFFEAVVGSMAATPRLVALVERGRVLLRDANGPGLRLGSAEDLRDLCVERGGRLVIKPSRGARGRDVRLMTAREDGSVSLNGEDVSARWLDFVAGLEDHMVTEVADNEAQIRTIFPHCLNTIRLLTMTDTKTAAPFIAAAVHRFGVSETIPTDNWSGGGLCCRIDLETGVMGPGVRHPRNTSGVLEWHSRHPDTGEPMEGVQVPRWEDVKATLLGLCAKVPFIRYAGWDLAVTTSGVQVVECNPTCDLDLLQVHGPLVKRSEAHCQ